MLVWKRRRKAYAEGLGETGLFASAGARMYAFKVVETAGKFKDEGAGIWTPSEINEHWDAIVKG